MCAVVPHILPKGGSGAAPLLDTPAIMTRFMDRRAKGAGSIASCQRTAVGSLVREPSALPDTPSTEGLSRPWTHDQPSADWMRTIASPMDHGHPRSAASGGGWQG